MNVHFRCDISLFDCDMQTSNKIQWKITKWTWSIATTTEKKKELHNVHWVSKNNTQHIATAELNIVKCCVTNINDCIRNVTLVATGLCVCFGFGKNWIGYCARRHNRTSRFGLFFNTQFFSFFVMIMVAVVVVLTCLTCKWNANEHRYSDTIHLTGFAPHDGFSFLVIFFCSATATSTITFIIH